MTTFAKRCILDVWQGSEYVFCVGKYLFKIHYKNIRSKTYEFGTGIFIIYFVKEFSHWGYSRSYPNYRWSFGRDLSVQIQKQSSRGVLKKRCSENMQRTPMPRYDFNKFALQFYWNRTLAWVLSCKFAAYFLFLITSLDGCFRRLNTFSIEH